MNQILIYQILILFFPVRLVRLCLQHLNRSEKKRNTEIWICTEKSSKRISVMTVCISDLPYDHDRLEEILELLVETVCSTKKYIRVAGCGLSCRGCPFKAFEAGYGTHQVRVRLSQREHDQNTQHQAISADHAVQRPDYYRQLLFGVGSA